MTQEVCIHEQPMRTLSRGDLCIPAFLPRSGRCVSCLQGEAPEAEEGHRGGTQGSWGGEHQRLKVPHPNSLLEANRRGELHAMRLHLNRGVCLDSAEMHEKCHSIIYAGSVRAVFPG